MSPWRAVKSLFVGTAIVLALAGGSKAGEAQPFVMTPSDTTSTASPFQMTGDDVVQAEISGRTLTYSGTESAGDAAIANNQGDSVRFTGASTAAQATIVNNSGGSATFLDQASGGSAFITNNSDSVVGFSGQSMAEGANITNNEGGAISFTDQSGAGSAAIANNGQISFGGDSSAEEMNVTNNAGATISFSDDARAGTAQLTNNGTIAFGDNASAAGSLVTNNATGVLQFGGKSTADRAAIANSGSVGFDEDSTAGSASLVNNKTGTVTFSDSSSAGAAFIANSGQLDFTGGSSAGSAGIVNNASGTLNVSGNATLGSASVNNGGRVEFSGDGAAGNASIVTGPGGVTVFTQSSDGGTASLQTDVGGTVDVSGVTDGAISVGSIAGPGHYYLGGVALTVGANGLSTTVDGIISDGGLSGGTDGSLVKVGTGTLTLSGTNSYSGATLVRGGELQAGAAGTFAPTSDFTVESGAVLALAGFDQRLGSLAGDGTVDLATATLTLGRDGQDSVFAGAIGGTGGLVKTGDGKFELAGTNAFSGTTTVETGELNVSGSIADSAVTVEHGAILSGSGTVGSTTVAGTLSRQDDGGTLTVNGDLTFTAGGTYAVSVDATPASDLIDVSGTATLAGSLAISPVGRFSLEGSTIHLISAGQVTGSFASVYTAMPFIDLSVLYGSDGVDLDVSRNSRDFAASADTANQTAVAQALDAMGSGSVYTAVVNSPSDAAARSAFDTLSGEIYSSIATVAVENDLRLRDMLIERAVEGLRLADTAPAFWARPYLSDFSQASDGNAAAIDGTGAGILAGADGDIGNNLRAGLAAGYGRSHVDVSDRNSDATMNTLSLSGYLAAQYMGWHGTVGGLTSWHDIDVGRTVALTGFEDSTQASYHALSGQLYGELGYSVVTGMVEWTPFVNFAYAYWRGDAFHESGGDAALSVHKDSNDGLVGTAGLRMASTVPLNASTALQLGGLVGWRIASLRDDGGWANFDGGDTFFVGGVPLERSAAMLGLNAGITSGRVSLGLAYDGMFGGGVRSQSLRGLVNVRF